MGAQMTPNCPEGRRRGEETVFALAVAAAIRQVAGNAATGGRGTHSYSRAEAGRAINSTGRPQTWWASAGLPPLIRTFKPPIVWRLGGGPKWAIAALLLVPCLTPVEGQN